MAEQDTGRGAERTAERGSEPAFFDRGDRRTHLEQLRHLSQWSRRVLLVTGPRGVGKSTLYRQLSATLEPRAKAARINGSLVQGNLDVLTAMVQGFGLAAPADAGGRVLQELVGDHARDQERADRFCVSLIDDAEMLEPKALEGLMELVAASPLRLVLFGEVRLVPAIERLAEGRGVGWHEIRLIGFSGDDVRAYLEWRLRQQGYEEPMPFTEAQVREIGRLSEGLPGRIDQMSNVLLARIQSAGHGPDGRRFPALPQGHRGLLALLIAVLGLAYLLWPSPDGPEVAEGPEMVVEPVAQPPRSEEPLPQEPAAETAGRSAIDSAGGAAGSAADVAAAPAGSSDPETGDTATTGAGATATGGAQPATAPQRVEPTATTGEPAAESPAIAQPRPEGAATPADRTATRPPGAAGSSDTAPSTAASEDGRVTQPATEPSAAPAAAEAAPAGQGPAAEAANAAAATPTGARDAAWILQQPADAFTLQLVSFSTADRADEYLRAQPEPADFARFRLQRDGRILHVVVYGRFDSRAAAAEASRSLPESVGRVEPWIRTFGQIQEGVRTALQP